MNKLPCLDNTVGFVSLRFLGKVHFYWAHRMLHVDFTYEVSVIQWRFNFHN